MFTRLIDRWTERLQDQPESRRQKILDYYYEVGPDYGDWSRDFNMHFGFYRWGDNPFDLESMLNAMNREVLDRLQLCNYRNNNVLDMGCGLGSTIRYALGRYPIKKITGITIVPWQVSEAKRLIEPEFYAYKTSIELEDFRATSYSDNEFDGVYALESSCYATGPDKKKFLSESYRMLRPGRKIVISDAYMKHNKPMNFIYRYCYRKMCEYWVIEEFSNINDLEKDMREAGFKDIQIEEISWNIAPSVMYVPLVAMKYFFRKVLPSLFVNKQRWNHFMAPIYGIVVGLARKRFGYYIVTARK